MDSEVSLESLLVAWTSLVLSGAAVDVGEGVAVGGGVGVAASVGVLPMPSATGVLVDTWGSGEAAGPQARASNNIKLDRKARASAFRISTGRLMADIRSPLCDGHERRG